MEEETKNTAESDRSVDPSSSGLPSEGWLSDLSERPLEVSELFRGEGVCCLWPVSESFNN